MIKKCWMVKMSHKNNPLELEWGTNAFIIPKTPGFPFDTISVYLPERQHSSGILAVRFQTNSQHIVI